MGWFEKEGQAGSVMSQGQNIYEDVIEEEEEYQRMVKMSSQSCEKLPSSEEGWKRGKLQMKRTVSLEEGNKSEGASFWGGVKSSNLYYESW